MHFLLLSINSIDFILGQYWTIINGVKMVNLT